MPKISQGLAGNGPSIIVAPDGTVHLRVHATTLHLAAAEFMELVSKSLDALALVTRIARQARDQGDLQ